MNNLLYSPMWNVRTANYKCGKCNRGVIDIGPSGTADCRVCHAKNLQPPPLTVKQYIASARGET